MNGNLNEISTKPSEKAFKLFVLVFLGLLIFIMAARTPLDTDFWWHIRAGEVTWTTAEPLRTDIFTFTKLGEPWVNHSWLAEVIYYLIYRSTGFLGVGLIVAIVATTSMLVVHAQMEGHELLKAAIIILSCTIAALVWSPRPQLFSLLLFAVVYFILYLFRYKKNDRLWILPIIFILWSNLHGGYSLGFLLLGAVIAGELFNLIVHKDLQSSLSWRDIRKILLWSFVCILAVLINPNGIETWLIPFKTVGVDALRQTIDEWASPDFHQLALQPFLWLLFLILAAVGLAGRKMDGVDIIGIIGFGYLAFLAKRNVAPFALFAAPVLSRYLTAAIQNLDIKVKLSKRMTKQEEISPKVRKIINVCLVAILGLVGIGKLYFVTIPAFVETAIRNYYPAGAINYLSANELDGKIFNSYGWGGYIEWTARESLTYIDGRTDLFGDAITDEWIKTIQAGEGWQNTFTSWGIEYCLIEPDRQLSHALQASGAHILYEDQISILFDASNLANK